MENIAWPRELLSPAAWAFGIFSVGLVACVAKPLHLSNGRVIPYLSDLANESEGGSQAPRRHSILFSTAPHSSTSKAARAMVKTHTSSGASWRAASGR